MRVALLTYRGDMRAGGQGVYVAALSAALSRLGQRVTVISGPPYPDLAPGVRLWRLPAERFYDDLGRGPVHLPRPAWRLFAPGTLYEYLLTRGHVFGEATPFSLRAFARLARTRQQFDVVHDNQTLGPGTALLRGLGLPLVGTIHHPLLLDLDAALGQTADWFARLRASLFHLEPAIWHTPVAQSLQRVIVVSADAARQVEKRHRLASDRMRIVYNGVDPELFSPRPHVAPCPSELLFVGRAGDRKKGVRYLLEALARLAPKRPELRLALVDSPERAPMAVRLIERLGLSGRARWTGRLSPEALVEAYNRAAVVVAPSLFEGFGLTAVEALACGRPVVATTAGAYPEIVRDGVSGRLAPTGDATALARAIGDLLADSELRQRMGAAGRADVLARFTWEAAARATARVYREVVERAAPHPRPLSRGRERGDIGSEG